MGVFSEGELEYLGGQPLGRLATVTSDGRPHVVPTGFRLDPASGILKIGAHDLPGRGQRRGYRGHIAENPWVAFVVDDVATVDPWAPRGVAVKGRAEIRETGGELLGRGFGPLWVRIEPAWVSSWGIDNGPYDKPITREVRSGG